MKSFRFAKRERNLAGRLGAVGILVIMLGFAATEGVSAASGYSTIKTISVGDFPVALAINSASNTVYAVDLVDNNVTVIDGATNTATSNITVGDGPDAVAFNPATGMLYVADGSDNNVTVIDTATNTQVANVTVGFFPISIAVDSTTNMVYVANNAANNVSVIDGATNTVVANVAVGDSPQGIAVDHAAGVVFVADSLDNNVTVINTATNTAIANVTVGGYPVAVAFDAANGNMYVACEFSGSVAVLSAASHLLVANISLSEAAGPSAIDVNPTTGAVFVADSFDNNVTVISAVTNTVVTNVPVGTSPEAVAVNPTSGLVYVANSGDNTVSVMQRAKNTPSIATTLSSSTITVGTKVKDSATLTSATSNAGGTVTYEYFIGGHCSGTAIAVGSPVTVTKGVVPSSVYKTFTAVGLYSWKAVYSGDTYNKRATSGCEPLTVSKASPTITTTLSHLAILAGQSVYDSATLMGSYQAKGTVTYEYFSAGACSGKPVQVGTAVTVTDGSVPHSVSHVFNVVGARPTPYSWKAVYSGDRNNNGRTSPCERLTVLPLKTPPTHTAFSCTASSFAVGTKITCTAKVSSSYPSPAPDGYVTFSKVSGTGGVTFSSKTCGLTETTKQGSKCSVVLTATVKGSITIQATYSGDRFNPWSAGTAVLTIT